MSEPDSGYNLPKWIVIAGALAPVLIMVAGPALRSMNLATVPYVDQRHDESLRYSERLNKETLDRAFEHSDRNFDKLNGRIDTINGKLDILIERREKR